MILEGSSPLPLKRRRLTSLDIMDAEAAKAKLAAVREKFGRDLRVFETSGLSPSSSQVSNEEESDDFYEFTAEDYYRITAAKKEDKYLKTRKIREAEEAARRSRITKAIIRVRFPDNHTLEAVFHPSEKIQCLYDLLTKALAQPELPFYLYTTPPKKQIRDLTQDFYAAGFVPGAIVYFSYDVSKENANATAISGNFLQEEMISLKGLDLTSESTEPGQSASEAETIPVQTVPEEQPKPAEKKASKPKWFKL